MKSFRRHLAASVLMSLSAFASGQATHSTVVDKLQDIAKKVEQGKFQAKPSRVFRFEDIREAHRVMEANEANGKMVVKL